MKILKSQLFKQLTVLVLLIGILVSSIVCTQASIYQVSGLLGSSARTVVFKNKTDNAGDVGDINSYPIKISSDDIGPEFDQLGFDILLGTERNMITYTGEIPRQWKDKDGLTLVPYSNYSAQSYEYWGIYTGPSGDQSIEDYWEYEDGQELAFVEEMAGEKDGDSGSSEVKSIRMYALTKASSFSLMDNTLSRMYYKIWQDLCGLSASILKIFITVKNISIAKVLEQLNLDKLVKLFNKVLLKNDGQLSIFMIMAIISFIFAIVGYAFAFARGGTKKISLKDILILGFCGLTIVSLCLYQNPTSLGTNAANAVNKLTTSLVYDSIAGGKDIWMSKAHGASNDSTEISYNESTLINKTLIELQILNQFGVGKIEDLDIKNFGNVSDIGFKRLDSAPGEKDLTNFGSNLGYYYWFANSPSPNYKTNLTNTYRNGVYNAGKVDVRLEAIISYLQKAYNEAPDNKTKARILGIIDSFTNPNSANGAVLYFLLTIEYILLCLVLARIVLRILLGKLLISGSVLGLPIAGPLFITTRKKCVDIAKLILLVLVSYSIQVFILSVIFDLVLNVIGVLITPDVLSIALALAATVGLHIFLPNLFRKLDRLFATINQSIGAGQITQYHNRVAQATSGRFNGLKDRTRRKTVTQYDADGNAVQVEVEQSTGIAKAAAITAAIAGYGNGNRGTNIRNIKKIDETSRKDKVSRAKGLADEMSSQTNKIYNNANTEKENRLRAIYGDPTINKERTFNTINTEALNEDDQRQWNILRQEYDSVLGNDRYKELRSKQAKLGPGGRLEANEQAELDQFNSQATGIRRKQEQFNNKIQQDINNDIREKYGEEIKTATSREIRTDQKVVEQTKGKGVVFKLKTAADVRSEGNKDLAGVTEKAVDAANKELQFHGVNNKNPNEVELEKSKAKTASGTASRKERVEAKKHLHTKTDTAPGTAHQEYMEDINSKLEKPSPRRKPFNKK